MPDMQKLSTLQLPDHSEYYIQDDSAIASISRSGNTFTATRRDGSTFTFTQRDIVVSSSATNPNKITISDNDGNTYDVDIIISDATQSNHGLLSASDKVKIDGIESGAEVNQLAFSKIRITKGSAHTDLDADTKTDTLELIEGDNITLTPSAVSDAVTIHAKDTIYTLSQDATDGHIIILTNNDESSTDHVQTLTIPDNNTTYTVSLDESTNEIVLTDSLGNTMKAKPSNASTSLDGFMSKNDKSKLDGIASGAEVNQNAFSNVAVDDVTISADNKTDTLTFIAGSNITITPNATTDSITISSSYTNTTYELTQDTTDGHKFTLSGSNGYTKTITIPDNNTTYTLSVGTGTDANQIVFTPSSGSATKITVPYATKALQDADGNAIKDTYAASFSISDHTITLKNKSGNSLGTVTVPDNNTTYTFAEGTTNKAFSVTPSGGSAQTVPIHGLGSASEKNFTTSVTSGSADLVTSGAVASAISTAIDNLPEPMIFKGTLGTNGTITSLPTASSSNEGWTYKVITAGTYASQVAKVGDMFVSAKIGSAYQWVYVPSGDDVEDTWRNIKVNGTEKLGTGISSGAVDFVDGDFINITYANNKITVSHADTSSQASVSNSGRTYVQSITLDGAGHVTKLTSATETVVNTDRYVNSAKFADDTTASANSPVKMTLTRAGSDTATVTSNIPKVSASSAGVAPKGASVSSQSQSTKFLREDGTWSAPSYTVNTDTKVTSVGNHYSPAADSSAQLSASASGGTAAWSIDVVQGVQLQRDAKGHVVGVTVTSGKIPGNPNTNYYHKTGSWNGLTYTAGKVGSPDDLAFTIPTGTSATTVAVGNHTHSTTIATSTGTNQLTLSHGGKYAITTGGTSFVFTMPTDNNTDTNVTQTATNTNATYEVLFSGTADNTTRTEGARKYSNLTFNPSTGTLTTTKVVSANATFGVADIDTANITEDNVGNLIVTGAARFLNTINGSISGNAATATSATKATQDESGNNIKATYAASFSISDHTITLKNKNGGSLGTVTVPDNNTTYTIGTSGNNVTLTPTGGTAQSITVPYATSANTATSSTNSYYVVTPDGRATSADIDLNSVNRHSDLFWCLASSSMTTSNPGEGYITTWSWDWGGYGAQLFMPQNPTQSAKRRCSYVGGTSDWGNWITLLDSNNYTDYTVKKDGTGASGTWGINITGSSASCTGNAATASKATAANLTTTQYGIAFYTNTTGTFGNNPCLITTSTGGLEVKGTIAGDTGATGHGLYGGGGYHNAYNNIILHGDASTGSSGIAFVSDKINASTGAVTNVNQPSDRAFIQYHACGITTATTEGTNPTLATSGESGKFVIGIGNDADDQIWLQTPSRTGLIHQVATGSYVIPDTGNTTGNVGSGTQPVYVSGGVLTSTTYSLGKSVPSDAKFTDTTYSAGDNMTLSSTTFYSTKRWNAVTQGQKWSRIMYVEPTYSIEGTNGILAVSCTRSNVVCNATFIVSTSHASVGKISLVGSTNYSNFNIRVVVNSGGAFYFEIDDTANSIASGTAQTWHCSYLPLMSTAVTVYTAFTDGTTIPSGFTACNQVTTVTGDGVYGIRDITRSGTTFTATRQNGTTFTFTQQDSNDQFTLGTSGNSVVLSKNGTAQNTITVPYATKATQDSDGSAINSTYLKLSGGTMTGNLTFSKPTEAGQKRGFVFAGVTDSAGLYYLEPNLSDDGRMRFIISDNDTDPIEMAWSLYRSAGSEIPGEHVVHSFNARGYTLTPIQEKSGTYDPISIVCSVNNHGSIGSSSLKWKEVYATTFYGALSGNATTATKANSIATEVGSSAGARPVFYSWLGDTTKVVYDNNFNYNPSGGVLTATKFVGSLQGNADTATKATQDGSGNVITSTYVIKTGDTMTGPLVINGVGSSSSTVTTNTSTSLAVGGTATNIASTVFAPTRGLQIVAGTGSNTGSTAIGFHNPNISSASFGYYNSDANNGLFRYMSDDTYWYVTTGSKKLGTAWRSGCFVIGTDGASKAVVGYLSSSTNGVTFGAHNSDLSAWDVTNISGSSINFRLAETTRAKLLDGCLSMFPSSSNYREGIRIHSYGSWSDIVLCGDDNTGDAGTTANSWFLGNNNGNFYIMRNGSSSSASAGLACVSNAWSFTGDVTIGNLKATILGVNASNGSSGGISLYAGTSYVDDYGICFRSTSNKGKHGYVTSDWATYFTMSNTDNRGWVFRRNGVGNVASINTSGNMVLNGSLTLGGNEANTSGCRLVYSSLGSVDFVFV